MTHIRLGKLSIVGSDLYGLSPSRGQAIIWTNAGILVIGTLWANCSAIAIEIYTFSFKKMHLKMSSGKWRPCCRGLDVLSRVFAGMAWLYRGHDFKAGKTGLTPNSLYRISLHCHCFGTGRRKHMYGFKDFGISYDGRLATTSQSSTAAKQIHPGPFY